jgi:hypothetical protein
METCNTVLKDELSAYRFVGGKILQMTSKDEIAEIEKALQVKDALDHAPELREVIWQAMKSRPGARLVFRRLTDDGKVGPY